MDKKLQINLKFIGENNKDLKKDDVVTIDNKLEAVVKNINQQSLGFGNNQVVIEYLFNVFLVGVPSGLIANLIYDYFLKGKNKFIDEKRKITIITKDELVKYIDLLKDEEKK